MPGLTAPGQRRSDVDRLYDLLDELAGRTRGPRTLAEAGGRDGWPDRGVYFFFEPGERRAGLGDPRVVRVGTHALKKDSRSTLWQRLSQHRGNRGGSRPGGGNHRGSIFRLLVGTSLIADGVPEAHEARATWGQGSTPPPGARDTEYALERRVSQIIGAMPMLWLAVDDAPGPDSDRGTIERNAIALLSGRNRDEIDPPTSTWAGLKCDRRTIRESGLWNSQHVDDAYEPDFLDFMERYVRRVAPT